MGRMRTVPIRDTGGPTSATFCGVTEPARARDGLSINAKHVIVSARRIPEIDCDIVLSLSFWPIFFDKPLIFSSTANRGVTV
jgi:hypothetical protein